jgi:hypothetical protein
MKQLKTPLLAVLLTMSAYAADWQTGKIVIRPTVIKTENIVSVETQKDPTFYMDAQAGKYCIGGDRHSAPSCYDMFATLVKEIGYARIFLADGRQYEEKDDQIKGSIYISNSVQQHDNTTCTLSARPGEGGLGYITLGYSCTVMKRLLLQEGGFAFPCHLQGPLQECESKEVEFQYRLSKNKKKASGIDCVEQIEIQIKSQYYKDRGNIQCK